MPFEPPLSAGARSSSRRRLGRIDGDGSKRTTCGSSGGGGGGGGGAGEGGGGAREESTQHGALTSLLFVKAGCVRFDEQERKGGAAAWWDASFSGYACVWSVQCERQRAV